MGIPIPVLILIGVTVAMSALAESTGSAAMSSRWVEAPRTRNSRGSPPGV